MPPRESTGSGDERQRVVRVPGRRRAKLTPAPGTTSEPVPTDEDETDASAEASGSRPSGPNDDRLRRDVPPHY
ncbi:hypothetical protein [Microbacterium immunditiarum]|uniref:Uncharacterized protein n=1 Tax=Microbacterium immunditiarum TaxID=337480 RepID=A0A7Y9GNB4_9MICO|nr:hypothetical protein [Microbacterium immunditiarum]NYE19637.1 hypothetical protein [Microbacterium immunditiarum]